MAIPQQEILDAFVEEIKPIVGENAWKDWFGSFSIVYDDGYVLAFPNKFVSEWVGNKYASAIKEFASKIGITLRIGIIEDLRNKPDAPKTSIFNENFTFESFIVGKSNEMAYEAALRVAKSKKISFNPLFIYGDVGVGKTHLMNSIANYRTYNFDNQKVLYLSAEQFMNTFIRSLQKKTVLDFKDEFRSVDVLLIDDFQFLASKDATQEEFFHTFNSLLENKKQIVISADKPPNSLPGVEARLKSRLGWGLVVDIHPATFELKLGILQSKVAQQNLKIEDNILAYIAEQVGGSIRELEGALTRIIKYAEWMNNAPITMHLAQKILENISSIKPKNPKELIEIICRILEIPVTDITGKARNRQIARARQKIVYILREHTTSSYVQIAKLLGGKDHSSIIYAESQAKKLQKEDTQFASDLLELEKRLSLAA